MENLKLRLVLKLCIFVVLALSSLNACAYSEKWKKIILISFICCVFAFACNTTAYDFDGDGSCNCTTCDDCELALNDNTNCLVSVNLTANITDYAGTCINDPANFTNKTFDCQGNTIDGDGIGAYSGILIKKNSNTIKNCNISQFYYNLRIENADYNNILNNIFYDGKSGVGGVYLCGSVSNSIVNNNNFTANSVPSLRGYNSFCDTGSLINNTISGNRFYTQSGIGVYLTGDIINFTLDSNIFDDLTTSGIYIIGTSSEININNTNFTNSAMSGEYSAMLFINSHNINIEGSYISNVNASGGVIRFHDNCENTTVIDNIIINSQEGINFDGTSDSNYSVIRGNNISGLKSGESPGIQIRGKNNINITNNRIFDSFDTSAMLLVLSGENGASKNIIVDNNTIYNGYILGSLGALNDLTNNITAINNNISNYSHGGLYICFNEGNVSDNIIWNLDFCSGPPSGRNIYVENNQLGRAPGYDQVELKGGINNTIINNNITGQMYLGAFCNSNASGNNISNNNFTTTNVGILFYSTCNSNDNIFSSNYFHSNGNYSMILYNSFNNTISENYGKFSVYLSSTATNETLNSNSACNGYVGYGINNLGVDNSGDNNTCDTTYNWNDTGTTGCSYECPLTIRFELNSVANNAFKSDNWTGLINLSIYEEETYYLDTFRFIWNSTNYTFFNSSLVLGMNFDNLSALGENNTHVSDFSAYGNNRTVVGGNVTTASGKYNRALTFNGVDDYVDCGNGGSLNITDAITIEAWIYIDSSTGYRWIVRKGTAYFFGLYTGDYLTLAINNKYYSTGGVSITENTWHHVAGTYDKVKIRLYIDGELKSDATNLTNAIPTNSNILSIGQAGYGGLGQYFDGTIDEVRIYNRALTPNEIKFNYFSNLQKYNETQWYYQTNITDSNGTYTYSGWANDSSGDSDSSEERVITLGGDICTCLNCSDCEEKLNNALCTEVRLLQDITDHSGSCIDDPVNFSNKTFDCQGHTIDGDETGVDSGILTNGVNNTIDNCIIRDFRYGINDIFIESCTGFSDNCSDYLINGTQTGTGGLLYFSSDSYNISVDNSGNLNLTGDIVMKNTSTIYYDNFAPAPGSEIRIYDINNVLRQHVTANETSLYDANSVLRQHITVNKTTFYDANGDLIVILGDPDRGYRNTWGGNPGDIINREQMFNYNKSGQAEFFIVQHDNGTTSGAGLTSRNNKGEGGTVGCVSSNFNVSGTELRSACGIAANTSGYIAFGNTQNTGFVFDFYLGEGYSYPNWTRVVNWTQADGFNINVGNFSLNNGSAQVYGNITINGNVTANDFCIDERLCLGDLNRVKLTSTDNQSIVDSGLWTNVTFNIIEIDSGNDMFNASVNNYTVNIKQDGLYIISYNVKITSADKVQINTQVLRNGIMLETSCDLVVGSKDLSFVTMNNYNMFNLSAGDNITLQVSHDNSGSLDLVGHHTSLIVSEIA